MPLSKIFDNATQLPSIPQIVQELILSFQDDSIDVDDITKKITMDQTLTAKVLRMANSAHFGGNRKISSTSDAIVLVGFNTLRTLVLASGITGSFDYPESFDKKNFWQDSFTIAAIAKWLAMYGDCDRETAFTCGMLHSIGTILIAINFAEEYENVLRSAGMGADKASLEASSLGFTSAEVSSELAKRWRFPPEIQRALLLQDSPNDASEDDHLAVLLHLAKFIYYHQMDEGIEYVAQNFPIDMAKAANFKPSDIIANLGELDELDDDISEMLD